MWQQENISGVITNANYRNCCTNKCVCYFVLENDPAHCVDFWLLEGPTDLKYSEETKQSCGPPAQLLLSILSISGVKYGTVLNLAEQ